MRVVPIDLIRWTFPKLSNDIVDAAIIWFETIVGRSGEGALNAQQAFAREKPYALAKLI